VPTHPLARPHPEDIILQCGTLAVASGAHLNERGSQLQAVSSEAAAYQEWLDARVGDDGHTRGHTHGRDGSVPPP